MGQGNLRLRTVRFRILIPHHYNDGRVVDPTLLAFIEDAFVALAEGWSSPGLAHGECFTSEGECQRDVHRIYEIAVASELVQRFVYLIHAIGRLLKQDSVYYEVDRSTQICIEPVYPKAAVHAIAAPADMAKNGRTAAMLRDNGKGA